MVILTGSARVNGVNKAKDIEGIFTRGKYLIFIYYTGQCSIDKTTPSREFRGIPVLVTGYSCLRAKIFLALISQKSIVALFKKTLV